MLYAIAHQFKMVHNIALKELLFLCVALYSQEKKNKNPTTSTYQFCFLKARKGQKALQ